MAQEFIVDLGFVIDRAGEKIAATLRAERWGAETTYVVALGEPNQPNEPFALRTLFDYVLRDGLTDFQILSSTMSCVPDRIPAGEIRALVRRIMGLHNVGAATLAVRVDGSAVLIGAF